MTVALARRAFSRPSAMTVRQLVHRLVDAEVRLANAWDEWEEEVLRAYRDKASDMLDRALGEVAHVLDERARFARARNEPW